MRRRRRGRRTLIGRLCVVLLRAASLWPRSVPYPNWSWVECNRDGLGVLAGDDQCWNRRARNERLAQLREIEIQCVRSDGQRLERRGSWAGHYRRPFATSAVARKHVSLAEVHLHVGDAGARRYHELHFRRRGKLDSEIALRGAA